MSVSLVALLQFSAYYKVLKYMSIVPIHQKKKVANLTTVQYRSFNKSLLNRKKEKPVACLWHEK